MSADEDTPVADYIQDTVDGVRVDPTDLALYASFVFVGVGIGAIFTVIAITNAVSPDQVQAGPFVKETTIQIEPAMLYAARDRVLVAAGGGFAVCNGYVLYQTLRSDEVGEA